MTRMLLPKAALAALVGWGVLGGVAQAGEWGPWPRTPSNLTELPPGHPPVYSGPVKHPVWDRITRCRPLGCWSSFNGYGCGSLRSEMAFIFGSCRTFYLEPCLKGPPPSSLPPWAGPESGYQGAGPDAVPGYTDGGGGPAGPQGGFPTARRSRCHC